MDLDSIHEFTANVFRFFLVEVYHDLYGEDNPDIIDTIINVIYYGYIVTIVGIIIFNVFADGAYMVRTIIIVLFGKFDQKYTLRDVSSVYGFGTLRDCDISFKYVRLARILRLLDFGRYSFYERTGIYQRSGQHKISSLQGSTLTVFQEPIPIFWLYKIYTKLVYWDENSLFIEHHVMTIHDAKIRGIIVSRQFAVDAKGESQPKLIEKLLEGLEGSEKKPTCPEYIEVWLKSMECSSKELRKLSS